MPRYQIVIPDIANTYELGYVLFNYPEGVKKILLKVEDAEIIKKFFQGKHKLSKFNGDLLLEKGEKEGEYFFKMIAGSKVLESWHVGFAEGLLYERERDTKIFFEGRG